MEQKKTSQKRSRKYGGSSSFVDSGEPSKAPHQDEDGRDFVGSTTLDRHNVDIHSDKQGISNRPVNEEHAFPETAVESEATYSIAVEPKQQGGNRGGV